MLASTASGTHNVGNAQSRLAIRTVARRACCSLVPKPSKVGRSTGGSSVHEMAGTSRCPPSSVLDDTGVCLKFRHSAVQSRTAYVHAEHDRQRRKERKGQCRLECWTVASDIWTSPKPWKDRGSLGKDGPRALPGGDYAAFWESATPGWQRGGRGHFLIGRLPQALSAQDVPV